MALLPIASDCLSDSYDPNGGGDFAALAVGRYQVRVMEVRPGAGKSKQDVGVKFECLCGTNLDEVGKHHDELFATHGKAGAVKRLLLLFIACGLTTAEELEACKKGGKSPQLDSDDLLNCQLIVGVEKDEFEKDGKITVRHKINYDICSLSHPSAADVPQVDTSGESSEGGHDPFNA